MFSFLGIKIRKLDLPLISLENYLCWNTQLFFFRHMYRTDLNAILMYMRPRKFQCVGKLRVLIWAQHIIQWCCCHGKCLGKCLWCSRYLSSNIILSFAVPAYKFSLFALCSECVCLFSLVPHFILLVILHATHLNEWNSWYAKNLGILCFMILFIKQSFDTRLSSICFFILFMQSAYAQHF